ncbi:MAG: hypothetical protein SF051_07775 [Elusimicrobiota bacterium]|nr:hypothetical protein [Elusimicrobiota bacterium]
MKAHLFEFRSDTRKLKCLCGWERTLKITDPEAAREKFEEHRAEATRPEPD